MANDENLIPINSRSKNEARELSSKGGRNSGRSRRKKRDMRDKMKMLLEIVPQNCEDFNAASEFGVDIENIDNETVMLIGLFNEAKQGNVQAVREVRNILGADNNSAELELRKKEFQLKKQALNHDDKGEAESVTIVDDIPQTD